MGKNKYLQLEYYASQGWPIFPINWIQKEGCSCGSSDCKSPGKHPLVDRGFKDATIEEKRIKVWHERWPNANWGMRTGGRKDCGSGILVVDIDQKNGGYDTWDFLQIDHSELIETVTVSTGGGGQHLWFFYPDGFNIRSRAGALGQGVDIRANGGYVLVPPSTTETSYQFEINPDDGQIMEIPDWILQILDGKEQLNSPDIHQPFASITNELVPQGMRHNTILSHAIKLFNSGMEKEAVTASLLAIRDTQFSLGDHPITDKEIEDLVDWSSTRPRNHFLTDIGNAERFYNMHKSEVRFCFILDKWLIWDGRRWVIDNSGEINRRAYITVREIYRETASIENEKKRKETGKHAMRSEARQRIDNMIHCAKPFVPINPEDLDLHPMLLNVKNGVVDLTTGTLLPHSRKYFLTKFINVDYDQSAECPGWNTFLDLITGDNRELQFFLQLAVGYSLTGSIDEHCLFFLHGTGQNGKTTFLETVRRLMKDYTQRIDIEALMQNWKLGASANPHIANMAGARFVLGSEIQENRKINESLVKDLTGGDSMTARHLYSNPFTFMPVHKLWLFGNHKPRVSGTDWGFWRRMRVVPFNITIPEENRRPMSEVLHTFELEMSGILTWAVTGCLKWQSNGLPEVDAVKEATKEYRTEQDLVQQFLDENCETHPDFIIDKGVLFTAWREWCNESGEIQAYRLSKNWFTRQMTNRDFEHGGAGKKSLKGLELIE